MRYLIFKFSCQDFLEIFFAYEICIDFLIDTVVIKHQVIRLLILILPNLADIYTILGKYYYD